MRRWAILAHVLGIVGCGLHAMTGFGPFLSVGVLGLLFAVQHVQALEGDDRGDR